MPRYKSIIEYDGTCYHGLQMQNHNNITKYPTISSTIQEAIYNFSHQKVIIVSAGRTDAGVHAKGQVIHFDLDKNYPNHKIISGLNFHLKNSHIVILKIVKVSDNFHARFHAKERSYEYIIQNRTAPAILLKNQVWHIRKKLDINAMKEASKLFIGSHDFSSFRNSECQAKDANKILHYIKFIKRADLIIIKFAAPAFLHNQIRIIVGTLAEVGLNRLTIDEVANIFSKCDRKFAGPTAPACGLYFMQVKYK